jgi:hypothetical protein
MVIGSYSKEGFFVGKEFFERRNYRADVLMYPFLAQIKGELEQVVPRVMLLSIKLDIQHLVHDAGILAQ